MKKYFIITVFSSFLMNAKAQDCNCNSSGSSTGHGYFYINGNTGTNANSKLRLVKWSNNNAHIDVMDGKNLHLNYYNGGHVYFGTATGSAHSIFRKDGRLGIGDTSPSFKLDVNAGSSDTHARFIGNYTGSQGIQVERSGGSKIRLVANYTGYGGGLESSSALRFAVD